MNPIVAGILGFALGGITLGAAVFAYVRSTAGTALAHELARTAAAASLLSDAKEQLITTRKEAKESREHLAEYKVHFTAAKTKLLERERSLLEQKGLLDQAKGQLTNAFKSMAAQALTLNNQNFLALANEKFKGLKADAASELEARKQAIDVLIKPVQDTLDKYQKESKELETRRLRDISAVGQQLQQVALAQAGLQRETAKLVNALKSPQVRGRWGEITLRRTAELAGMSPHCDFVEQETAVGEAGRIRPDMIVRMPQNRTVVVDSKVPLAGFLEALESTTEELRSQCLTRHAQHVRKHVESLACKEYWAQLKETPEFVVLFIPNDTFLSAAAERDPNLIELALARRIVIATPTTFVAILRAIEFTWGQQRANENVEKVMALGKKFSDRFAKLVEHLQKMGAALGKATEAYNDAIGSFELRLIPAAREFKELGAGGQKDIEDLERIPQTNRTVAWDGALARPESGSDATGD